MEHVEIAAPDGTADAYLVRPEGEPRGGVLFIMDAFGLRPRIAEMAERIAAEGYVVLAPNVFYRGGPDAVGPMPDLSEEGARGAFFTRIGPLMQGLDAETVAADSAAWLASLGEEVDGPLGVTGYCMGARYALRAGEAHPDRIAAIGGFHGGGLVTDAPDSPHRAVGSIRAEVYFGHADEDPGMTRAQGEELDAALAAAGVAHRSEFYAGARHGYTMADTPVWNEAACERHFAALFDLLGRTVGA